MLDTDTHFRDELTRMGIDTVIVSPEDIPSPVKISKEVVAKI